jgi:hypothetical protein
MSGECGSTNACLKGAMPAGGAASMLATPANCAGRKPPFLVVKRHARPYKSPVQNLFTVEKAKGT